VYIELPALRKHLLLDREMVAMMVMVETMTSMMMTVMVYCLIIVKIENNPTCKEPRN
jgi:hypothetical protein